MLPSAPLDMTMVVGGAGRMKCRVSASTTTMTSRNGPYVSAASRQEMREICSGRNGLRTARILRQRGGTLPGARAGSPEDERDG